MLKDIILLFKYRGYEILGRELAERAEEALCGEEGLWWEVDFLMPVPLHPKREKQRGFNQAGILARELGKRRGIEIIKGGLVKKRNVPPQTFLSGSERRENVSGAFHVVRAEKIKGKNLILVDDVFTTGATLTECCRVLKEAGSGEVRALTIAQAV